MSWPTLNTVISDHVKRTIAHAGGNVPRAANLLGVPLRTFQRWQAKARAGHQVLASRPKARGEDECTLCKLQREVSGPRPATFGESTR